MAQIVGQGVDAAECSSCVLLRRNLSDVVKRLGDHDMLVRMHDLATKQHDRLQKQLCALTESEANYKRECAAMHVRHCSLSQLVVIQCIFEESFYLNAAISTRMRHFAPEATVC
jgi:hypothetical protein